MLKISEVQKLYLEYTVHAALCTVFHSYGKERKSRWVRLGQVFRMEKNSVW